MVRQYKCSENDTTTDDTNVRQDVGCGAMMGVFVIIVWGFVIITRLVLDGVFFLCGKNVLIMILGAISAIAGLGSSIYGAVKQSQAAKEEQKLMEKQAAANEAWYNRNYHQDYLNSVQAQNAMKRYRNAWEDQAREARARQVISGGSPAQTQAVMEAGAKGYGEMIGNLAAQGEQNKQAIDAQKLAMDTNLNAQGMQLAQKRQAAGANMVSNGIGTMVSGLQGMELPTKSVPQAQTAQVGKITDNFVDTSLNLPKTIKPLG